MSAGKRSLSTAFRAGSETDRISLARLYRRIDHYYACGVEIASVEGDDRKIVRQRGRRDEAVLDRRRAPLRTKSRAAARPTQSRRGLQLSSRPHPAACDRPDPYAG